MPASTNTNICEFCDRLYAEDGGVSELGGTNGICTRCRNWQTANDLEAVTRRLERTGYLEQDKKDSRRVD